MCSHRPPCPAETAVDHARARVVADHHDQGWVLLCNGIVRFDDGGELFPDGHCAAPRPWLPLQRAG